MQRTILPERQPKESQLVLQPENQPLQPTSDQFSTVLSLIQEVVGTNRRLTRALLQQCERVRRYREAWGYSPHPSDISSIGESPPPPPYSPPRQSPEVIAIPSSPSTLFLTTSERSKSPTPETIPNLPIPSEPEAIIKTLLDRVNKFAKEHGFGIAKYNRCYRKGRIIRYTLRCDRFGLPKRGRGAGIRARASRKCDCQWQIIAKAIEEGKWLLRQHSNPIHSQHNHIPSLASSAYPSYRRLTKPIKDVVETTSRRVGIRARDVGAIIQEQFPESVFTQRDIYNARARINREKLNGYTPTAALIKLFDEREIPYIVKWADDEPNRLVGLVWTFPYSLRMWKRFPEVISFDNTYNTNRFKLPLFQATGQTCLGSVFNVAFGLIDNERLEGFQFLSQSILQLINQNSIR
ncbi:mutator-like element [Colletotrichum truncatum]|uniref:Mutator-like element n=1 Tax=Colletotrichum truncatum TaxID=5467 RepID=A0ACC3ZJI0_COLTU